MPMIDGVYKPMMAVSSMADRFVEQFTWNREKFIMTTCTVYRLVGGTTDEEDFKLSIVKVIEEDTP